MNQNCFPKVILAVLVLSVLRNTPVMSLLTHMHLYYSIHKICFVHLPQYPEVFFAGRVMTSVFHREQPFHPYVYLHGDSLLH